MDSINTTEDVALQDLLDDEVDAGKTLTFSAAYPPTSQLPGMGFISKSRKDYQAYLKDSGSSAWEEVKSVDLRDNSDYLRASTEIFLPSDNQVQQNPANEDYGGIVTMIDTSQGCGGVGQEQQDIAAANGGQGFFFRGSKYEEQFIEQLLSLELVKCFAKVQNVRQLKPITSALEGDDKAYRSHWS
jgi:hypothetical protein